MGAAYSQDLRERVIGAVESGLGAYEVAPLLRVSVSYIYKALGRRRARQRRAPRGVDHLQSWRLTMKPCVSGSRTSRTARSTKYRPGFSTRMGSKSALAACGSACGI